MRILLFSDFELPSSCANATRVFGFAKILKKLGHEVELLGVSYREKNQLLGTYEGFEYQMLQAGQWHGIRAYKRTHLLEMDLVRFLKEHSQPTPYDAILLSNVYYDLSKAFISYSKKYKCPLLVNEVEWYDKTSAIFDGPLGKIKFLKNRIALKKIHVKMHNIIAISSLLDNYYKDRGCNTVRIPTIIDLREYEVVSSRERVSDGKIHVAYAGMIARKDFMLPAIESLDLLTEEERSRIQLDFYGPTQEQLCGSIGNEFVQKYKDSICVHGKIPYEEVKEKIAKADFTVLLRPNMRYANAGFPTKVGESMACGTPVIANLTSDLDRYIIDGKTGIVCANETKESCAEAFRKALSLSHEEYLEMRKHVSRMAVEAFDYDTYTELFHTFLEQVSV